MSFYILNYLSDPNTGNVLAQTFGLCFFVCETLYKLEDKVLTSLPDYRK